MNGNDRQYSGTRGLSLAVVLGVAVGTAIGRLIGNDRVGILIGLVLGVCVWTLIARLKVQKGEPWSEKENLSETALQDSGKSDIDKPGEG